MSTKYWTTRNYTAKQIVRTVKAAKEDLATGKPRLVFCFTEFGIFSQTSAEYMRWFRKCLNAKINRNEKPVGRKHSDEYQNNLRLDSYRIKDYKSGLRSSGCSGLLRTREMVERFPYINNQPRDW